MRRVIVSLAGLSALVAVAACEQVKSYTPLSPSIAGPIAGVTIDPPVPVAPTNGAEIPVGQQPVVMLVDNAHTNGVRPLEYVYEIATTTDFNAPVYTQTGVKPGEGRTTFVLPQSLAPETTYFWRVQARDGANSSTYSAPVRFRVFTPVVIGAPRPASPGNGSTTTTTSPTLVVNNADRSGPHGPIRYLFAVATDQAFGNQIALEEFGEGGSQTSYALGGLQFNTTYFWRARAFDPGHTGPWSDVWSFKTPAAPPTGGGGGGGGPTGPAPNDAIDLRDVTIVKGENIGNWAVTSTITSAHHSGQDLCTGHTKQGQWPVLGFFDIPGVTVEGNQWMFAFIGGKWYGGAGEWLRPGQTCKTIDHVGSGVFYDSPPLHVWNPAPGETIGVAVSTPARSGQWGTAERSNIVLIKW